MKHRQRRVTVALMLVAIVALAVTSCGAIDKPPGTMHSEVYTVSSGDTLWSISEQYIAQNTYGPRDIREFYHGIIEGNWEVFKNRQPGEIHPGDKLTITWWTK